MKLNELSSLQREKPFVTLCAHIKSEGKPEGFVGRTVPAQERDWSVQENVEDGQAKSNKSAVVEEQRETTQHVQQEDSSVVCKQDSN